MCQSCHHLNPIHCKQCKSCEWEFPRKDRTAIGKDILSFEEKGGKITKQMLNSMKGYLEDRLFRDEGFELGKRRKEGFEAGVGSLVGSGSGSGARERNNAVGLGGEGLGGGSVFLNGRSIGEVKPGQFLSFEERGKHLLAGKAAYGIECVQLCQVDTDTVAVLLGYSINQKVDEISEDLELFTLETQDHFGLTKLLKVGRAYSGGGLIGVGLLNIKRDKKKNTFSHSCLNLSITKCIETKSDPVMIKMKMDTLNTKVVVLYTRIRYSE